MKHVFSKQQFYPIPLENKSAINPISIDYLKSSKEKIDGHKVKLLLVYLEEKRTMHSGVQDNTCTLIYHGKIFQTDLIKNLRVNLLIIWGRIKTKEYHMEI